MRICKKKNTPPGCQDNRQPYRSHACRGGSACPQTYGSISVCQQMAELQPQPQMKMAIRGPIPFSILENKDPSRGYEPVLEKASGPCACNTSVNMHPEGILLSVLLQVHAAISLSFLATHTLATWSRCLLLPGICWFIVTSHFPDSSQVCIAFLYHKLVVSCLTCCEMTPHSYKIHQTSSVPQMHFQNGSKETFIYIYNYNCKQSFIERLKMCNAKSNSLVFKTC